MEVHTTGGQARPGSNTAAGAEVPTVDQLVTRQRQLVGWLQDATIDLAVAQHSETRDFATATCQAIDKLGTLTMIQVPPQPRWPSEGALYFDDKTGQAVRVAGYGASSENGDEVMVSAVEGNSGYSVPLGEWEDRMIPAFKR